MGHPGQYCICLHETTRDSVFKILTLIVIAKIICSPWTSWRYREKVAPRPPEMLAASESGSSNAGRWHRDGAIREIGETAGQKCDSKANRSNVYAWFDGADCSAFAQVLSSSSSRNQAPSSRLMFLRFCWFWWSTNRGVQEYRGVSGPTHMWQVTAGLLRFSGNRL